MAKIRSLVYTYEDTGVEEYGANGFTSDRAIIEQAERVNDRAVGEWRLWKVGKAPDGLRLIRTIHAIGLDAYPFSRLWSPLVDAAMEWEGLDLPAKMAAVHDYRTHDGKVIRARRKLTPEERVRILANHPEANGVRVDGSLIYAPALGEYSPYAARRT